MVVSAINILGTSQCSPIATKLQHKFSASKSGLDIVKTLLQHVSSMACVHTMDDDSVLEREYSIEFHQETLERIHRLLILCAEECQHNQKNKIILTKFVTLAHSLLMILGCSLRRFAKANTSFKSTSVNADILLQLRIVLTQYLTNPYVDTCNRHASAGCLDVGYELLYPTSLERVAMVAHVFEEYRQENTFLTSEGRHMMM